LIIDPLKEVPEGEKIDHILRFSYKRNYGFFTMRLVRHWKRLPREVVDDPPLEVLKTRLDGALSNLV